ncbi:MAG: PD40 domain-containing protein [Dehalococcoidia bacterium]|nr:PD40 domain-containing protein [Dehalococcoidia bacterium]
MSSRIAWGGYIHNHFCSSPGGRYIATNRIMEDTNGNGILDVWDRKQLFILDLEDGNEWPLYPEFNAGWGGIDWSLDGEWIYLSMSRMAWSGGTDIYRMHPDGSGIENLTVGIEKRLGPAGTVRKFVSDVGVSHDGEWIAFLYSPRQGETTVGVTTTKSRIAVCRIDGTEAQFITDGGTLPSKKRGAWHAGDFDPEFSPDGQEIVFSRMTDSGMNGELSSFDIMQCRTDGTNLRRLTSDRDPAGKGIPDWAEDGRIIYMVIDARDSYVGPEVMSADGSTVRRYPEARGTHFRWVPG